jgi:hypothetical protein
MAFTQAARDAAAATRARNKAEKEALAASGAAPLPTSTAPTKTNTDGQIWLQALIVTMRNREVRVVGGIPECIPVADEVLRVFKAKFK